MRTLRTLFLVLVTAGVLSGAVFFWASVPTVYRSTSSNKLVSCLSGETSGQERGIDDPVCQSVLKGKYEVVWVQ